MHIHGNKQKEKKDAEEQTKTTTIIQEIKGPKSEDKNQNVKETSLLSMK